MLAELRRRRGDLALGARHDERLADHVERRLVLLLHALGDAEMLDLRIGEHLVDVVDRAARHAGLVHDLDPFRAALVRRVGIDLGVERLAVLRARLGVLVLRLLHQRLAAERAAEAFPDRAAGGGDVDETIGGLEHAGRDRGRMVVAGLLRHFLVDQPSRGLEIEHENLRLQQRRLNVLTLLRRLALEQRRHDAECAEQSRGEIGDRDADTHRALAG